MQMYINSYKYICSYTAAIPIHIYIYTYTHIDLSWVHIVSFSGTRMKSFAMGIESQTMFLAPGANNANN